ncbi:MAG: hypothetical protein KF690_06570 [Bacteroidetes bacterium]|nr:hypothetical protein [Bacteroidota bacterium]
MIKADAGLSKAEIEKIKIIIYKMDRGLPVKYPEIKPVLEAMSVDADYKLWTPEMHREKAFEFLAKFHNMPAYRKSHLNALWEIMEMIMEVGEITDGEQAYMDAVLKVFNETYGVEIGAAVS